MWQAEYRLYQFALKLTKSLFLQGRKSPVALSQHSWEFLQARILECVAFPLLPGNLPNPEVESRSPALWVDSLTAEPQGNLHTTVGSLSLLQRLSQPRNQPGHLHWCRFLSTELLRNCYLRHCQMHRWCVFTCSLCPQELPLHYPQMTLQEACPM